MAEFIYKSAHSLRHVDSRARVATSLVSLVIAAASCASDPTHSAGGAGASGASSVAAGAPAATAGAAPTAAGAGGAAPSSGGTSGTMQPGHAGNADSGDLFGADASVPVVVPEVVGAGGAPPAGDGNTAVGNFVKSVSGTAIFTQTWSDVTVVITLKNCAAGDHRFFIYEGDSCDTAKIEGPIWSRGDGLDGPLIVKCANNTGTLTYTRSGNDPKTSWTVGDHSEITDVSRRVFGLNDPTSKDDNRPCGNFF